MYKKAITFLRERLKASYQDAYLEWNEKKLQFKSPIPYNPVADLHARVLIFDWASYKLGLITDEWYEEEILAYLRGMLNQTPIMLYKLLQNSEGIQEDLVQTTRVLINELSACLYDPITFAHLAEKNLLFDLDRWFTVKQECFPVHQK